MIMKEGIVSFKISYSIKGALMIDDRRMIEPDAGSKKHGGLSMYMPATNVDMIDYHRQPDKAEV